MPSTFKIALLAAVALGFGGISANADTVLTLDRNFIEQYKDKLTIACDYSVDVAPAHAHPASEDADMHVAGHCTNVGLRMVAEIMNANSVSDAEEAVQKAQGTSARVQMVGAWRIWPEHAGTNAFVQFGQSENEISSSTNPPHVFEIHPITELNDKDLSSTLHFIAGYDSKSAEDAFQKYDSSPFQITPEKNGKVTMEMPMIGYNYVEFLMQLQPDSSTLAHPDDGTFVYARIRSDAGDVVANKVRVGFVKGSLPYSAEQTMAVGQCLKILGIPRLDLALVSWRLRQAQGQNPNQTNPDPSVLTWSMPYEMIAVGVDGAPSTCPDA